MHALENPRPRLYASTSHRRQYIQSERAPYSFDSLADRVFENDRRRRNEMKIKLTSVYVDDQDKALRFYTEVLGFIKKADFSNGPYRWLTVASPEEPNGTELQLALDNNPAAKAY